MLHDDKSIFEETILKTSEYLGVKVEIVEKDYYVTLFLKELVKVMPDIIFKGGTSLSKCYHVINRFSEDIDLNIQSDTKPSESKRKKLKSSIIQVIESLNFNLTNAEKIRSRRDFNRYIINYPSVMSADFLKEQLIVETAVFQKAYPTKIMKADSLIYQFLFQNGYSDFISEYNLEPFEINVQAAERTMIDKIFAIADYYMLDTIAEHSRHIYDIYKLCQIVSIDEAMKNLVASVAEERKPHKMCVSVQNNIDIVEIIKEIIEKSVYKEDFNNITVPLLFESISYEQAITALSIVIDNGVFDKITNI